MCYTKKAKYTEAQVFNESVQVQPLSFISFYSLGLFIGIDTITCGWFQNFFSDKSQCAVVNDVGSTVLNTRCTDTKKTDSKA